MACENKIFKNIIADCTNRTTAGIEQVVYLFNRSELAAPTYKDNKKESGYVNAINMKTYTPAGGGEAVSYKGYKVTGYKKNLTASFEKQVSDESLDTWTDTVTLVGYDFDASNSQNINYMENLVAVIERKGDNTKEGNFIIFGLDNGLYVSADTWSSGENNGARSVTLSSLSDQGESVPYYVYGVLNDEGEYDYDATVAQLNTIITE